jgi:hypothetical protein
MIDYILADNDPVEGGWYKLSARLLCHNEEMEYFPVLRSTRWTMYTSVNKNGATPRKRCTVTEIKLWA